VWPGRDLCGRVAQPLLAFCAALAVRRAARLAVWRLNDNLSNEPTPNPETPQGDDHTGRRLCCARVRRHLVNLVQIKLRGMTHLASKHQQVTRTSRRAANGPALPRESSVGTCTGHQSRQPDDSAARIRCRPPALRTQTRSPAGIRLPGTQGQYEYAPAGVAE
jgi:hypothetical protein